MSISFTNASLNVEKHLIVADGTKYGVGSIAQLGRDFAAGLKTKSGPILETVNGFLISDLAGKLDFLASSHLHEVKVRYPERSVFIFLFFDELNVCVLGDAKQRQVPEELRPHCVSIVH